MDKRNNNSNSDSWMDPWNTEFYETGSTRPPKTHRGLFTLVLVAGIILGSVLTAFGGINARVIREWTEKEHKTDLPASLQAGEGADATVPSAAGDPVQVTVNPGDGVVQLNPSPQGVETATQDGGLSLQAIYEKCIDSTVSILCTLPRGSSTGSGVVLTVDGYVITNYHVVENAVQIAVLFSDGQELPARLVGGDKLSDLAVLHVEAQGLTPAEFGNSDSLRVGDTVVAIGDPLGVALRGTMTDGIVSAINRNITTEGRTLTLIQTNAALNSGNSGGPLINCYGQVIGINTMKIGDYVNSAGVEGLGFAIPSTTVKEIVDQLISQGYVSGRPELGITGVDVPAFYQYYYRIPAGVYVTAVTPGGAAEAQGIQVQDIILAIGGERVNSSSDVETILYSYQAGDTVEVVYYRDGEQYKVELTLGQSAP